MQRRSFLSGVAATTLASVFLRSSSARAFGVAPGADLLLPADRTVESILEVYLIGGVSPYESFYVVDEFGKDASNPAQWHAFLESGEIGEALDACGVGGGNDLLMAFGEDARGREVSLGPFVEPLRQRPDLLARFRMFMTTHQGAPHEVGIPLALTGRAPGSPDLAGLGTHIQRYFRQSDGGPPVSFVLQPPSAIQRELIRSAAATGRHPGSTRPLQLRVGELDTALQLMKRTRVGSTAPAYDALMKTLAEGYSSRLRLGDVDLRARANAEIAAAITSVEGASDVATFLDGELRDLGRGESCGVTASVDATAVGLSLAAHLLTHPTNPARYVCVVDGGFGSQENAGGYDSHANTPQIHATNLTSLMSSLAAIVNRPGEGDPAKLDLDRTLIILNTEFGRSPTPGENGGRGHWPYAFPVAFLGGPIRQGNAGIFGSMDEAAAPELASSPISHRIAAMMALGIWPFDPESFNVSDVADAASSVEAAGWIRSQYLGIV